MAAIPAPIVLATLLGATRIERAQNRDSWRVVGGWGDGIEFTSVDLVEARESPARFLAMMRAKVEAQATRVGSVPPRWFPGSGDTQNRDEWEDILVKDRRRYDDAVDAIRYSGPSLLGEPGSVVRFALKGGGSEYRVVAKPPETREMQEVILKPRKYGKDK